MSTAKDGPCLSTLSTSEIVGLSFIAESGVISTVAVLVFAVLVIRNVIEDRRYPGPNGPSPLIRTHVDGYMISLMFADLMQGLGAVTSAKWAANGRVECSAYCTAQGAIQQLGETGVAMSTLVITLHTFATVFFRWQPSRWPRLWIVVITLIWTFILLFVVIGYAVHRNEYKDPVNGKPYFAPTPFWCWISSKYMIERIFGEYFWLWSSAVLNIALYPFLFFTLRGNIEVDPGNWRRIRCHRRSRDGIFGGLASARNPANTAKDSESTRYNRARNREAMKMFWYPISYTILVLPLTINRWATFGLSSNSDEPVADMSIVPTSIVLFIFGLSGLTNVLLFLLTRPNLLLFNVRRERKRAKRRSEMIPESAMSFNREISYPNRDSGVGGVGGSGGTGGRLYYRGGKRTATTDYEDYDYGDPDVDEDVYGRTARSGSPASPDEFYAGGYPPAPQDLPPPTPGSSNFHTSATGEKIRLGAMMGVGHHHFGDQTSTNVIDVQPGSGGLDKRFSAGESSTTTDPNPTPQPPDQEDVLLPPPPLVDLPPLRKTSMGTLRGSGMLPVPPEPAYSPSDPPRAAGGGLSALEEEERRRVSRRARSMESTASAARAAGGEGLSLHSPPPP